MKIGSLVFNFVDLLDAKKNTISIVVKNYDYFNCQMLTIFPKFIKGENFNFPKKWFDKIK